MSILKLTPSHTLQEVVGMALGCASVCWEHPERAGVFDSDTASKLVDEVTEWNETRENHEKNL